MFFRYANTNDSYCRYFLELVKQSDDFLNRGEKTLQNRAWLALKVGFQQSADGARMGNLAFAVIRLVIGFNVLEPVAVIHHQPG